MGKSKNKRNLNQKGSNTVQEEDKKEVKTDTVEDSNSVAEQAGVDNQENTQDTSVEKQENDKKDKPTQAKSKLTLVKGKVAEKGLKSFYRAGVKFSDEYQEIEVDKPTLARLKAEPKLTIQIVK